MIKKFFSSKSNINIVKDCKDCKNFIINLNNKDGMECLKFPIIFNNESKKKIYNTIFMSRQNNKLCGAEGKYFEKK